MVGAGRPHRRHGEPLPRPARTAARRRPRDGGDGGPIRPASAAGATRRAPVVGPAPSRPLLVGAVAVAVAHALNGGPSSGGWRTCPGCRPGRFPVVFLVALVVGGLGEEGGWRGLAWVRLRRHLGLRDAALVLTVPWALWHLPLFWIDSGLRRPVAVRRAGLAGRPGVGRRRPRLALRAQRQPAGRRARTHRGQHRQRNTSRCGRGRGRRLRRRRRRRHGRAGGRPRGATSAGSGRSPCAAPGWCPRRSG